MHKIILVFFLFLNAVSLDIVAQEKVDTPKETITYFEDIAPKDGRLDNKYLELMDTLVVRIVMFKKVGDGYAVKGMGTGILLPDNKVLTAAHVTKDVDLININMNDGKNLKATIIASDDVLDVALLKCKHGYEGPYLKFRETKASIGDRIYMFGFELGKRDVQRTGYISGQNSMGKYLNKLFYNSEANITVNPGMSGGPVLDVDGRIIGVITNKVVDVGSLQSIFTNISGIDLFMENTDE